MLAYIRSKLYSEPTVVESVEKIPVIIYVTWIVFVVEMVMRFFPSEYESPGCQKQFKRNYIKSGSTDIDISDNNATMLVAITWIVFNGIFGALHMAGKVDYVEEQAKIQSDIDDIKIIISTILDLPE